MGAFFCRFIVFVLWRTGRKRTSVAASLFLWGYSYFKFGHFSNIIVVTWWFVVHVSSLPFIQWSKNDFFFLEGVRERKESSLFWSFSSFCLSRFFFVFLLAASSQAGQATDIVLKFNELTRQAHCLSFDHHHNLLHRRRPHKNIFQERQTYTHCIHTTRPRCCSFSRALVACCCWNIIKKKFNDV